MEYCTVLKNIMITTSLILRERRNQESSGKTISVRSKLSPVKVRRSPASPRAPFVGGVLRAMQQEGSRPRRLHDKQSTLGVCDSGWVAWEGTASGLSVQARAACALDKICTGVQFTRGLSQPGQLELPSVPAASILIMNHLTLTGANNSRKSRREKQERTVVHPPCVLYCEQIVNYLTLEQAAKYTTVFVMAVFKIRESSGNNVFDKVS